MTCMMTEPRSQIWSSHNCLINKRLYCVWFGIFHRKYWSGYIAVGIECTPYEAVFWSPNCHSRAHSLSKRLMTYKSWLQCHWMPFFERSLRLFRRESLRSFPPRRCQSSVPLPPALAIESPSGVSAGLPSNARSITSILVMPYHQSIARVLECRPTDYPTTAWDGHSCAAKYVDHWYHNNFARLYWTTKIK